MKQKHLGILIGCLSAVGGAGIASAGFAIANSAKSKSDYATTLAACKADAFSRISDAKLEALARYPSNYKLIKTCVSIFTDALDSDWITPEKALGIGILAGGGEINNRSTGYGSIYVAIRAYNTNDEAKYNLMMEESKSILNYIKNASNNAAYAAGVAGSNTIDAYSRNTELLNTIHAFWNDFVEPYVDKINNINAFDIGLIVGEAACALARQDEAVNKFRDVLTICIKSLFQGNITVEQAKALGKTGVAGLDAIARQPEASGKALEALALLVYDVTHYSTDVTAGFTNFVSSYLDAIARQPEASGTMLEAYTTLIEPSLAKASSYNAGAIGTIASAMFDGIARQPEASSVIIYDAKLAINYILESK